jgi:hypothetical protein
MLRLVLELQLQLGLVLLPELILRLIATQSIIKLPQLERRLLVKLEQQLEQQLVQLGQQWRPIQQRQLELQRLPRLKPKQLLRQ